MTVVVLWLSDLHLKKDYIRVTFKSRLTSHWNDTNPKELSRWSNHSAEIFPLFEEIEYSYIQWYAKTYGQSTCTLQHGTVNISDNLQYFPQ